MNHEMKLQPKYYDFILNGTKRIEIRLNDEKKELLNELEKFYSKEKQEQYGVLGIEVTF